MIRRRRRWETLAPVIVVLSMTLAACGTASGTEDTEGVASLDDDGATATTAAEEPDPEAPTDPEDAFALFEECMAEKGIDLSQGATSTNGGGVVVQGGEDDASVDKEGQAGVLDVDPEEFEPAERECRKHMANVDSDFELTPEQEAAMEDARLEFQKCMEEHGVEGDFMIAGDNGGASLSSGVDEGTEVDPQAGSELDPEELDEAHEECLKIFEETPELEGMFGEGEGSGFGGPDE